MPRTAWVISKAQSDIDDAPSLGVEPGYSAAFRWMALSDDDVLLFSRKKDAEAINDSFFNGEHIVHAVDYDED